MNVTFEYLDHLSSLNSTTQIKSPDQAELEFKIEKYQLLVDKSYQIDLSAHLSNNSLVSNSLTFSVFVEPSELLVYIEGGNRQNGYENELIVRGVARDLDVIESEQETGLTRAWRCEDIINSNQPCKNIKNEVITLNDSAPMQQF